MKTAPIRWTASRGRGLEEQWRLSAEDAAAKNAIALPYEHFALPWSDLEAWLERGSRISQLALDDTTGEVHVPCQPGL